MGRLVFSRVKQEEGQLSPGFRGLWLYVVYVRNVVYVRTGTIRRRRRMATAVISAVVDSGPSDTSRDEPGTA